VLGMLVGEAQSGKTTALLKLTDALARQAVNDDAKPPTTPIPVYITASLFRPLPTAAPAEALLTLASSACGQSIEVFRALWDEERRPVCLLIDGLDEIPSAVRSAFKESLQALTARRKGHSIITSCRPGTFCDDISEDLRQDPAYTEWAFLPLDEREVMQLLRAYSPESDGENGQYVMFHAAGASVADGNGKKGPNAQAPPGVLLNRTGLLVGYARASKHASPGTAPQSPFEMYQLVIESLLPGQRHGASRSDFNYTRVQRPVLAYLAFTLLRTGKASLDIDDALCRAIEDLLQSCQTRYGRSRHIMPREWDVEQFIDDLKQLPMLNAEVAAENRIQFANSSYRDYFAAVYLREPSMPWPDVLKAVNESNPEKWLETLVMLADARDDANVQTLIQTLFSADPLPATDIWMERRPPTAPMPSNLYRDYFQDTAPNPANVALHPSQAYLSTLLRHTDLKVRLSAIASLTQLGLSATESLLDVIESDNSLTQAVATHGLLHLGESLAIPQSPMPPLITIEGDGIRVRTNGCCNLTIGPLVLCDVPLQMKAAVDARFGTLDFDLVSASWGAAFWSNRVSWFAYDSFRDDGVVNWVKLARRCMTVARCAEYVYAKALSRPNLSALTSELAYAAATYDLFGDSIATDLGMPWRLSEDVPTWQIPADVIDYVQSSYRELRWLFDRTNRREMLTRGLFFEGFAEKPSGSLIRQEHLGIKSDHVLVQSNEDVGAQDLPAQTICSYVAHFERIEGMTDKTAFVAIDIKRVTPGNYLAAETLTLGTFVKARQVTESSLTGVRVGEIDGDAGVRGIRVRLVADFGDWKDSSFTGIQATLSQQRIIQRHFDALTEAVTANVTNDSQKSVALSKVDILRQETSKGTQASDRQIAKLVSDLAKLVIATKPPLAAMFTSPPLNGVIGDISRFALEQLAS